MRKAAKYLGLAVLAGVLSSCATTSRKPPNPLTLNAWQLIEIAYKDSNPFILTPQQQTRHRINFNRDGSLQLDLDCNKGNGNWSASDPLQGRGVLTIEPFNSTRAFCPPPSFGNEMALDLPNAQNYAIRGDRNELRIYARNAEFVFAPAPR